MESERILTVKEIAEILKISTQMVYSLIRKEEIPAFKVGSSVRVLEKDFGRFIERRKRLLSAENRDEPEFSEEALAVRHLFAQNGTFFLDDVSFEIPARTTLGVIGPSGAGKTLLLHCIAGIHPISSGAISLQGRRIDGLPANARNVGVVFQDLALYPNRNGAGNIAFPQEVKRTAHNLIDESVRKIAKELGISDEYLSKGINQLPQGIKQLVAIGRAENRTIRMMVMDEPLKHLDAHRHHDMRAFLKSLVAYYRLTTVFALNDVADALALCEHLLVIDEGRLVQFGPTEQVYRNPADPGTMGLLSLNGANSIRVSVEGGKMRGRDIRVQVPDGEYSYCFRPDEIDESGKGFRGEVIRTSLYDGGRDLADCALQDGTVVKILLPHEHPPAVEFSVREAKLYPFVQEEGGSGKGN